MRFDGTNTSVKMEIRGIIFLLMLLAFNTNASAVNIVVDDLGDPSAVNGGTTTLRDAINMAADGDVIYIDVSGTITLNGDLPINRSIEIIGPEPTHLTIDCSGANAISFNSNAGFNRLYGVTISGFNGLGLGAVNVGPSVNFEADHVMFKNNNGTPLYNNGGFLSAIGCAFISNTHGSDGGGFYNTGGGTSSLVHCTFGENVGSRGGGIYANDGDVVLEGCTFVYNQSLNANSSAMYNEAANIDFTNTLIYDNNFASDQRQLDVGSGSWAYNSNTGNYSNESNPVWTGQTGDFQDVTNGANVGLSTEVFTNGFGYSFYPYIDENSALIDRGAYTSYFEDARGWPRGLDGNNVNAADPDIGAVEFSPFCVTNVSGGNDLDNVYTALQSTGLLPPYVICFDINGTGPHELQPFSFLTFDQEVFIDGFSQPGSKVAGPGATVSTAITPADLRIQISGANISAGFGIEFQPGSDFSAIRGVGVYDYTFLSAITISASDVQVSGCHIGFDYNNNIKPNDKGIEVKSLGGPAISFCIIGGAHYHENNVVSGNTLYNIDLNNGDFHELSNNFIGTFPDGSGALDPSNTADGIIVQNGTNHQIGIWVNGPYFTGNLISGNRNGIFVPATSVAGNFSINANIVGMDIDGTTANPNAASGLRILNGGNITIGSPNDLDRNFISGNAGDGILLNDVNDVLIRNNYIGLAEDGLTSVQNGANGIVLGSNSQNVQLGGSGSNDGNYISGNGDAGVVITDNTTTGNVLYGNVIGLNTADASVPNNYGVQIQNNASGNFIGGTIAGQENIISGNSITGVYINGGNNTQILNNYIGVASNGATAVGNAQYGIHIINGNFEEIGNGTTDGGNIISGNGGGGIRLESTTATNTYIRGNYIGLDATGLNGLGNGTGSGITIFAGANNINIGGTGAEDGNVISGHSSGNGIFIAGSATNTVSIAGNYIGTDFTGDVAQGNNDGIYLSSNASDITVGVAGSPNVISGNSNHGINILDVGTGVNIVGNYIGVNQGGTVALGNGSNGVFVNQNTSLNPITIGGSNPGDGNVISANGARGITLDGDGCTVQGNRIGVDFGGAGSLGNGVVGIGIFGSDNLIGGVNLEDANIIANNSDDGIDIPGGGDDRNAILRNSIYNNGSTANTLGIDLNSNGVDANDTGDGDAGANEGQNYPIINGVTTNCGAGTNINFSLNSVPSTTFRIEFFHQDISRVDPSGHGEGDIFIEATEITTDAAGDYSGTYVVPFVLPIGDWVTATATSKNATAFENTSEFSQAVEILDQPFFTGINDFVQDVSCNGAADGQAYFEVIDGSQPFMYSWSNSAATDTAKNLGPGTYTLTVTDAAGCTVSSPGVLTVNEPSPLNASATSIDVSCNGASDGQIDFSPATGGTPPYLYSIDGGATTQPGTNFPGLSAGNYDPYVEDANGCNITLSTLPINEPSAISASVTNSGDVLCFGGNNGFIDITATGGLSPYQYSIDGGSTTQGSNSFLGLAAGTYNPYVFDANGCFVDLGAFTISQPAAGLNLTETHNNISCAGANDGSITLTTTGGTTPYQYSIDNGATLQASGSFINLGPGTYDPYVLDANGCNFAIGSINLSDPTALIITAVNKNDVTCNGLSDGFISIVASGGTAPYQYSIDNGVTWQASPNFPNLAPGNYDIAVQDANGCTVNNGAVTVINEPAILDVSVLSANNVSCFGGNDGSIQLSGTGGTMPYQYSIDNGATLQASATFNGLPAGNYDPYIEDGNGCVGTASPYTITEPTPLVATASATDVTCNGDGNGTVTVTVTGGTSPYNYSWSPSGATTQTVTNLGPGTQTVTVTDNNSCITSASATVNEPAALVLSVPSTIPPSCNGTNDGSIQLSATGGTPPYQYSIDNGATLQASNTFNSLPGGTYDPYVIDANGCIATDAQIALTDPAAIVISNVAETDVTCFGANDGTITVTASGGTGLLSYSIDNGITFQAANTFASLMPGNYDVVVQDQTGCSEPWGATITITEPTVLAATASSTDVNCNGAADGTATVAVSGGTTPYSFAWSPTGAITQSVTNLGPNTYTVTVTDANNCVVTSSTTVTEPTALALTLTSASDPTCAGSVDGNITLSAAGGVTPYQYSIDNGTTLQASNIFNGLSGGTYDPYVIDANGCIQTLPQVTITTPTSLIITNVSKTNVTCNGANDGTITVTATGGTGALEYSRDGVNFQASNIFLNVPQGGYTITVRDANLCIATWSTVNITEPSPLMSMPGFSDPLCNGACDGSIDLSSVSGGVFPYSYSIDGGATWLGSPTFSGLCAGTYTASVKDINNCQFDSILTLTDPALEDASFDYGGQTVFCHGTGAFLPNLTGTPGGNFFIDQTGVTIAAATGELHMDFTTYTGTAYVKYVTPCGVADSLLITIAAQDDASFDYGGTINFCVNDPDPVANITGGGVGTFSSSTGLTFVDASTGEIDLSVSVPGSYWVVFTTNGACADMDSINIAIASPGTAAFDGGQPVTFCANDADYTFTATPGGGTFSGAGIDAAGLFSPPTAGLGTFYIYYTTGTGNCLSTDSLQITVNEVPTATVSGGGSYCVGEPLPAVYFDFTGNPPFTYDVYVDGSFVSTQTAITVNDSLSPAPSNGVFTIQNIQDANGCTVVNGSGSATVTPITPAPAPNVPNDTTYCLGENIETIITTASGSGFATWYSDNAGMNQLSADGTYVPPITTEGIYTYYAITTDNGCLGAVDSVVITVLDAPANAPNASGGPTSFDYCPGDNIVDLQAFPNVGGTIVWYDANATQVGSGTAFNPGTLAAGTYTYDAVEQLGSCDGPALTFTINVAGASTVDAGNDVAICAGDSVQLNATGGIGYLWSGSGSISDSSVADPWVSTQNPIYFFVNVETANNCFFTDSVFVDILPEEECGAHPFNAFSPDGDGVNDIWMIANLPADADVTVKIFNRWGDVLHTFNGYNNLDVAWDGTGKNGEDLPAGTYFYILESTNPAVKAQSGWVQLMR